MKASLAHRSSDQAHARPLVTTVKWTVLDLVKRPELGDAEIAVWAAVDQLYRRCGPEVLAEIAQAQRMRPTLTRLHDRLGERG